MSRRNREDSAPRFEMRASYRIVNPVGTVPVAKPASNIQLTPIVQPVSFVPYSSQGQPLYTMDENEY